MSKTEGIGGNANRLLAEPSEAENREIFEEFEKITVPRGGSGSRERIHPLRDGVALCKASGEEHGISEWSNPKPIEAFPLGADGEPYRPYCRFCVKEWRRSQ